MSFRNPLPFALIAASLLTLGVLIVPDARAAGVEFHDLPAYIAATNQLGVMKFDGASGGGSASHPEYVEGYATLRSSFTSDGAMYYFGNVCSRAYNGQSINGSDYYVSRSGFGTPQGHDPSSGSLEFTLSQKCRAAGIMLASTFAGKGFNSDFKARLEFYDGATPVFATEVYSFPDFFNGNPNKRFLGAITDVPFDRVVLVSKGNNDNTFIVADNFRYGYPIERQVAPIRGGIVPVQPIYRGDPPRRNPPGIPRTGTGTPRTGRTQPNPNARPNNGSRVPSSGNRGRGEYNAPPGAPVPRPAPMTPARPNRGGGVRPQGGRRRS